MRVSLGTQAMAHTWGHGLVDVEAVCGGSCQLSAPRMAGRGLGSHRWAVFALLPSELLGPQGSPLIDLGGRHRAQDTLWPHGCPAVILPGPEASESSAACLPEFAQAVFRTGHPLGALG